MASNKAVKAARKLATGQFAEVAERVLEEYRRLAERRRYNRTLEEAGTPGPDDLLTDNAERLFATSCRQLDFVAALRSHRDDGFMPGFASRSHFAGFVAVSLSAERERIIDAAEQIMNDRFPVFNFGFISYGNPPRWGYDPVHEVNSPECFYADIDYLDPDVVGDSKIVWEVSRMQFVYDLGQAYVLTGDERYPRKFLDLIRDWRAKNRLYHGINYCSALEAAFRIHALIWAIWFFKDSPALTDERARDLYAIVRSSADFVAHHLSKYFAPNTHLLGEAYSLFIAGELLPEMKGANSWRKTGYDILLKELDRQFTPDGMHAELSTAYHGYALEFLLSFVTLCRQRDLAIDPLFETRLRQGANILRTLQRPDGTWPHIGDEDGGRLFFLSRVPALDFGPLLEACQGALAQEAPGAYVDSFWFTDRVDKASTSHFVPTFPGFPNSGIVTFSSPRGLHASFQCGAFGYRDSPHSHADMLHLDLACGVDNFLVDPGTGVYTSNLELRNLYRSAAAHNGPSIVGTALENRHDPFGWLRKPDCTIDSLCESTLSQYCRASYRLRIGKFGAVSASRAILFLHDRLWIIVDSLRGAMRTATETCFVTPFPVDRFDYGFSLTGSTCKLAIVPCVLPGEQSHADVHPFPIYDDYLSSTKGNRIKLSRSVQFPSTVLYLVLPYRVESELPCKVVVRGEGDRLSATLDFQSSTMVIGVGKDVAEDLRTDAELVMLEFRGSGLQRAIIANGSFVDFRNHEIIRIDQVAALADILHADGKYHFSSAGSARLLEPKT